MDCPFILIQRLSGNKFLIGNLIAADGLGEVVVEEATVPKRQSEAPPPTYEEALYRYTAYMDSSFSKDFLSKR